MSLFGESPSGNYLDCDPHYCVEGLPISSVGVLIADGPLSSTRAYVLVIEQLDQLESNGAHPWGFPAGKVEEYDTTVYKALRREVLEETGLDLSHAANLDLFLILPKFDNRVLVANKLVYQCHLPFADLLDSLGLYKTHTREPTRVGWEGHFEYFSPLPVYISNGPFSEEIGRRALVPVDELFEDDSLTPMSYRWESTTRNIRNALQGEGIIWWW